MYFYYLYSYNTSLLLAACTSKYLSHEYPLMMTGPYRVEFGSPFLRREQHPYGGDAAYLFVGDIIDACPAEAVADVSVQEG